MQNLIKQIRQYIGLSQSEMAIDDLKEIFKQKK